MSYFTSKREKQLWIWTTIIIVGIYSTLGLAATIAEEMYNQGLSAVAMLFSMFLIALAVLVMALKFRPGGMELGVGLGIAAVYIMFFLRLTIPERSHLIEYSVVAIFIYEALLERVSGGRRIPFPALMAMFATILVGVIDECIQLFLPSRVFDTEDILFNTLAAVMAIGASALLRWIRKLNRNRKRN